MRKFVIEQDTRIEIDRQVQKIIRGLGNPEPPLDLAAVFKLLELDPQFFRTSEDGVVRETISKVRVGTKLFFENPVRIWDAVKAADLKALWIPKQKLVIVDGNLHEKQQRWNSAHEIGHSILEWHRDYTFGDDKLTVVEDCHVEIEAEANYAAGRLLFLQDRFAQHVLGTKHTLKSLSKLSDEFGNSWTSTLYRTVETLDSPCFAIIGSHPHRGKLDERTKHLVTSAPFHSMFPNFTEDQALAATKSYCSWSTRGPLGRGEIELTDANSARWIFESESFALPQGVTLTLAVLSRKKEIQVPISSSLV